VRTSNGKYIKEFEETIADFAGARYGVAVDSGTNAIFLCLKFMEYTGAVEIPKRTYMSVPMAIINAGATPVFRDISWEGSYIMNPTNIIDACNIFYPNMYRTSGMFQILSFQQKKQLGIGKGGMILTDNEEAAKTLRRMAFDGRDYMLGANEDEDIIVGHHMNMPPDDAVRGLLIFNAMNESSYGVGGNDQNYRDLSKLECFKDYV
jgi:dTDP-4-amino-4,6-dideoxygalactose transaminase